MAGALASQRLAVVQRERNHSREKKSRKNKGKLEAQVTKSVAYHYERERNQQCYRVGHLHAPDFAEQTPKAMLATLRRYACRRLYFFLGSSVAST
jgi:hypothetical protein